MIDVNQGSSYCCIESRPVPTRNVFTNRLRLNPDQQPPAIAPDAPETFLPIGHPNRQPGWLELLLEILRALELHPAALEAAQKAIHSFNTRHARPVCTDPAV